MITASAQISGVADVGASTPEAYSLAAADTITVQGAVGRGSSTFLMTGREYAYIQEAGVTRDNFTLTASFNGEQRYMWTLPSLTDAEKDSTTIAKCLMYINSCWACTASNMFVRGGWSDGVFASEDKAMSYFMNSFTKPDFYTVNGNPLRYYSMSTGCAEFGVDWLLGGKYDFWSDYGKKGWSIPESGSSGGFYKDTAGGGSMKDYLSATEMTLNPDGSKVFRAYIQTTGTYGPHPSVSTSAAMLDEAFGLLQKGYSVGVTIGWYSGNMKKRNGGHAITVYGFSYDESRNGTPGVYTGIFVADSDDDYGNVNRLTDFDADRAPNRVKYLPIEYNSAKGIYVCTDYGTNGVIDSFQYLAPRPAGAGVSVAADIDFIRNDRWNAEYSVGGSAADALSGDRAERLDAAGSVFMALNLISDGPGSVDRVDVTVTIDGDAAGARSYSIERHIDDEAVAVVVDLGQLGGGVHELAVDVSAGENSDSLAVGKLYVAEANNVVREFSVASDIYSDGMELLSGDLLEVLAGEVARNCTVAAASEQLVKADGLSVGSTIGAEGVLTVEADGTARNSEVRAAGVLFVNGKAEDPVVRANGALYADRNSLVTGAVIETGGLMDIKCRGAAAGTDVGGEFSVANGRAENTVVRAGGTMSVLDTGVAETTVVQNGGKQLLRSGGSAADNTLTGSESEQRVDGTGSIASGNRLDAATQIAAGGGVVTDNILVNGAVQDLSGGAVACGTELSGGAVQYIRDASAYDTVIGADCRSLVFAGGISVAGVVKAGGSLVAGDPDGVPGRGAGAVRDLTVEYGGTAAFADGAKLFGTTTVAGRITVTGSVAGASAGVEDTEPSLVFDLSARSAADEFIINDLGRCSELHFGIDLADTQELGSYRLSAAGAAGFDGSIAVYAADGEFCGEIDADEFVVVDDRLIALESSGDALYVTVASSPYAPREMPADFIECSGGSASWKHIRGGGGYLLQFSGDDFETLITVRTDAEALSANDLPADLRWRIRPVNSEVWTDGGTLHANADPGESVIDMDKNWDLDLLFATGDSQWGGGYFARHLGVAEEWGGTGEVVGLAGKNRIADLFSASSDANVLFLTDDADGDALFVDDIYTALPDGVAEQRARIAKIDEIRAGAGDDVVDMTSQRFDYAGGGLTVRGGDGDDVIWANRGDNMLFGDAGGDRLVGASGNDVIAGGSGDDRMHGGGGEDIFTFCSDWGADTVEQLADGAVTLWFAEGDMSKWDAGTLTYIDGENSVSVTGVAADKVALKFGDDGSADHAALAGAGAFAGFTSENVFERKDALASR